MGNKKFTRAKESLRHNSAQLLEKCGAENLCAGRYETIAILLFLQSKPVRIIILQVQKKFKEIQRAVA